MNGEGRDAVFYAVLCDSHDAGTTQRRAPFLIWTSGYKSRIIQEQITAAKTPAAFSNRVVHYPSLEKQETIIDKSLFITDGTRAVG